MNIKKNQDKSQKDLTLETIITLPNTEQKLVNWIKKRKQSSLTEIAEYLQISKNQTEEILLYLEGQKILRKEVIDKESFYQVILASQRRKKKENIFLKQLDKAVGRIKFSTLIILTFITAFLLIPFVFSSFYLPNLRENFFETYQLLQGDLYKQITGYLSLIFIGLEMILTARKRGRGWWIEIKIPGDMRIWRGLHIFLGVALVGITLIHTLGSNGLNFNAIFLWVFFGVTLSALIGVVAEVGILESPRKSFGANPQQTSILPTIGKGALIRGLRQFWLGTHIFLVSVFAVMLVVHIILAYYYQ